MGGLGAEHCCEHVLEHLAHLVATVEAELEFCEVAWGALAKEECVVGSSDGSLEVAQHDVDCAEPRVLGAGLATAGDDALVHTFVGGCAQGAQTVGDDGQRVLQFMVNASVFSSSPHRAAWPTQRARSPAREAA